MKFSFTTNLFDMNVEKAARDYKETKQDKDFLILYEFVHKVSSIVARKYGMKNDQDIIQNCGLKLIEKIHQFDPEKAPFYTWCYTVVVNEFNQKYKKAKRIDTGVSVEDIEYDFFQPIKSTKVQSYIPEYFPEDNLTEEDIEAVIDLFDVVPASPRRHCDYIDPKIMKEIFLTYIVDKRTAKDVAEEYNITPNRVKLIVYRYRRFFIDFLKRMYPHKIFPEQIYGSKYEYKKSLKKMNS